MILNKDNVNSGSYAVNMNDILPNSQGQDFVVQHEEKKVEEPKKVVVEEPKKIVEEPKKEEPKKEEVIEKKEEEPVKQEEEEEEEEEIVKEGDTIVREGNYVSISVIGGAVVDIIGKSNSSIIMGTSNPGNVNIHVFYF